MAHPASSSTNIFKQFHTVHQGWKKILDPNQPAPRRAVVQQYIVDPVLYQSLAQQQRRMATSNKLPKDIQESRGHIFCPRKRLHCGCGWIWKRLAKIRWKMISQPILFEIPLSLQISLIQKKIRCLKSFLVFLHPFLLPFTLRNWNM